MADENSTETVQKNEALTPEEQEKEIQRLLEEEALNTPGQTQPGHKDQAKTNGHDVTETVQKNEAEKAKKREAEIEAEVQKRLKEHLKVVDSESVLLEAHEYEPRYQKTRVPTSEKAHNNAQHWKTVEREEWETADAKALIDHFQRHEKNLRGFDALKAINTQLKKKA